MKQKDSKYKFYLYDLGELIKERALEAKAQRDAYDERSLEREFQSGRVMAFNEIISLIQQQAEGFDIPLEELRLHDLEPDRDLT
jgi:hypothetical protein